MAVELGIIISITGHEIENHIGPTLEWSFQHQLYTIYVLEKGPIIARTMTQYE